MVVPAAVALFVLGEYQGAIAVSGMAIVNSAIGLVQEVRAKRHLDKLALLVEARARVVRDGTVRAIPAGEVVRGDTVLLNAGEAVVADGPVLESRFLEVDEALLRASRIRCAAQRGTNCSPAASASRGRARTGPTGSAPPPSPTPPPRAPGATSTPPAR